jgi:hypothetical protein
MRIIKVLAIVPMLLLASAQTGSVYIALGSQQEIDLEKGLVAYWSFDGGEGDIIFDESGNYNDAGLMCGGEGCLAPAYVAGKSGYALEFDGVDDYVYCGSDATLDFGDGDFTLAAWVNSRVLDIGGNHQFIINRGWGDQHKHKGYGLYLAWEPTYWHYTLNLGIADGENGVRTPNVHPTYFDGKSNQWLHVVAQRESNTICMYLNGKEWSTADASDLTDISVEGSLYDKVYIGNNVYSQTLGFNGLIDQVRVYNRALTEDEIRILYESDR